MVEEQQQVTENNGVDDKPLSSKPPMDPVRRWTFIVLGVCLVLLAWYLRADRVTPYTSQAHVNALVVPIAAEVSGTISGVFVKNNQIVEAGQKLFQIDIERYRLAVDNAKASIVSAKAKPPKVRTKSPINSATEKSFGFNIRSLPQPWKICWS